MSYRNEVTVKTEEIAAGTLRVIDVEACDRENSPPGSEFDAWYEIHLQRGGISSLLVVLDDWSAVLSTLHAFALVGAATKMALVAKAEKP